MRLRKNRANEIRPAKTCGEVDDILNLLVKAARFGLAALICLLIAVICLAVLVALNYAHAAHPDEVGHAIADEEMRVTLKVYHLVYGFLIALASVVGVGWKLYSNHRRNIERSTRQETINEVNVRNWKSDVEDKLKAGTEQFRKIFLRLDKIDDQLETIDKHIDDRNGNEREVLDALNAIKTDIKSIKGDKK